MAEEIELLEVQDNPVEEGAGIYADNAEDVVIDFSWLRSMEEKLASTSSPKSSPSFTICRVPKNIRKCDNAAYSPKIVSIGPFHRPRENLQPMEEHKWRYLHKVLAFGEGRNNLEKFLKELKALERRARNCYSECNPMTSEKFVEMMLLDGCFIIFLILHRLGFVETDVLIYGNYWMLRLIHLDLLLLENQLPFFVLECLWHLIDFPWGFTLTDMALASFWFFSYELELKNPEEHDIHHLLHLLHLSLKPDSTTRKVQTTSARGQTSNMIPSATELQRAGVRFQLKQARSLFEVGFEQGLMEMPCLGIYNETGILFRNLIALEQCFPQWGNHLASYCFFFNFLVNTPRDVSILREAGIIRSGLGSDNEVALLFNKLVKEIDWNINENYLTGLYEQVNEHTQKIWPKLRANLPPDYFGSPWAIISMIGAVIILIILPLLQTYFSIIAYFMPPKP